MGHKIKRVLIWINEIYSDMQGPAPDGFHVPTKDEWEALYGTLESTLSIGSNTTTMGTYLKMPVCGLRENDASINDVGSTGRYWSSTPTNGLAYRLYISSSYSYLQGNERSYGMFVRCVQNSPTIPTSSWTVLYQGSGSAGIFHNPTDGLISLSSDGSTWYTLMDKNLGATTVYNYGDTLTDANCGNVFQRGNNYAFPGTLSSESITTSSTRIDASNYGPGNYYFSSTFITRNSEPYSWDSSDNGNLRGGVSQGSGTRLVEKQIYSGTPKAQPVNETFSYTGSDQTWTVPYTQEYIITAKGAGSNTSAGGLGQGTILLNAGDKLSIMVGQSGNSTSSATYGFGGSSNYSSNRAGGGLSGVFTGDSAITASDSSRALVIGGGAGGGQSSSRYGGAGGGETGQTGGGSNYGTAGGGGTQTGRGNGGNAGSYQFNGGNGSGTYGRGGGGGRWGGNGSIGDGSGDDDKGAGGGSGYVISTASNRTLTQGGGSTAGNNGQVTIVSVLQ